MLHAWRVSILLVFLSAVRVAQGAEFEVHPSLAVSEEFTDNVFNSGSDRVSDYITRTLPGIAMDYKAPSLSGGLRYVFDYRHYARNSRNDEIAHSLGAKGRLTAVDNLLFLDVSEEYRRVSLDATRDVTRESLYFNQSDRNIIAVSPSIVIHPGARTMIKTAYHFVDTRYFDSPAIDKNEHIAALDMEYELSKRCSLTAGYAFNRSFASVDNLSRHQVLGGFRYEYADKSFAFAQAGKAWIDYDSGQHLTSIIWNAGITHVFDTVTIKLATGVKYDEDPLRNIVQETFVNGTIEKRFHRGTVSLSPYYSEYLLTETDTLQTRKYGTTAQGRYEILTNVSGRLAGTVEKYEQPLAGSYTRRIMADSGVAFLLAEHLTLSLSYAYIDYSSPGILTDNRHVNLVAMEIRKLF